MTFALALEYLQAEFYLNAVQGYGLPASDQGDGAGGVSGAHRVRSRRSSSPASQPSSPSSRDVT